MSFLEEIDRVVGQLLPRPPVTFNREKYINDPILGVVEVNGYEQSIIDTPLYQRLRYIRQTGFTYLTFPTAHHTRFEHSLGVMTIATKIWNILKRKQGKYINEEASLTRIRLAALMHDIGHSCFSHTSEEFYGTLEDINNYQKENGMQKKGAGEIISSLIVTSKPFRWFFSELQKIYPEKLGKVKIEEIANLITGKSRTLQEGFEADIITSSIDADKLDYFPRDGRAAGLDVSLDIHRLINCVEIQETEDERGKRNSLIINRRGYNALQQLLFARATLTATVYHHHKVRACDAMLKNIFRLYNDRGDKFKVCKQFPGGIDLRFAPNFLYLTDNDVLSEVNNLDSRDEKRRLLDDLFSRRLYKRVLKISLKTITTEKEENDETVLDEIKEEIAQFISLRQRPEQKEDLDKRIIKAAKAKISGFSEYDIALDIPHRPGFDKAGSAQINISSDEKRPNIVNLKEVIPIDDWIKGYQNFFGHAYVFGPPEPEIRVQLAISSAQVLKDNGGIVRIQPTYDAVPGDIREAVRDRCKKEGLKDLFRERV